MLSRYHEASHGCDNVSHTLHIIIWFSWWCLLTIMCLIPSHVIIWLLWWCHVTLGWLTFTCLHDYYDNVMWLCKICWENHHSSVYMHYMYIAKHHMHFIMDPMHVMQHHMYFSKHHIHFTIHHMHVTIYNMLFMLMYSILKCSCPTRRQCVKFARIFSW